LKNSVGSQLSNDDLRNALIKVAKAAGFAGFSRVHDLRYTFNSLMQMNGVDPATMGKILGHRDIETTHQQVAHVPLEHDSNLKTACATLLVPNQ